MTLGTRIAELRKQKGYSQEYLAQALNISRQAVSKWEQDQSSPDTGNLIALATLLDVSVEYLATGKEATPPAATMPEPPKNALTVQKILGVMLIGFGLFAAILGVLFSYLLILIGAVLTVLGILLLVFQALAARFRHVNRKTAFWLGAAILILITVGLAGSMTSGVNIKILVGIVCFSIAFPPMVWGIFRLIRFLISKQKAKAEFDGRD